MGVIGNHKKYWISALLVAVIAVGGAKLFNVGPFHKTSAVVTSGPSFNAKGEPKSPSSSASQRQSSSGSSGTDSSPKGTSSLTLFTPSGDFVSNHHPNLSGSPAPNTMTSVCNTTPGATCKITFTMDGITKQLPSKTADSNGTAYWSWKLQEIGLTAGSWKVQAIASLNGNTKTATDALDLVVSQ